MSCNDDVCCCRFATTVRIYCLCGVTCMILVLLDVCFIYFIPSGKQLYIIIVIIIIIICFQNITTVKAVQYLHMSDRKKCSRGQKG